jgi:hypothetical protein
MRDKLGCFLPQYPVTVVYPVVHKKWLSWMDKTTGECSDAKKTPRTGTVYDVFEELYGLKPYLAHENLRFRFPLLEIVEYRLLDGWGRGGKRGSHRFDRVPRTLCDEIAIDCVEDYLQFIPYELAEPFTVAELGKLVGSDAGLLLNILRHLEIVARVGKRGRAHEYIVKT